MSDKLRVVYDVDDTLWNLSQTICDVHDLNFDDIVTYVAVNNPRLTEEQKQVMLAAYGEPEIFKQCKFYDGYERIFDLEKNGIAEVWISSGNMTEAVMAIKAKRLEEEVANINMNHVRLTCSTQIYQGRVTGDILIDDSLMNMIKGDFKYNILIDMPHNRNEDDIAAAKKEIIRVTSLSEAVDLVEDIVRRYN